MEIHELAPDALIDELETSMAFRRPAEVRSFLEARPELIELLPEAYAYVKRFFGPDSLAQLEIYRDPEGTTNETLFAQIVTPLPLADALQRLDELDYKWYLSQPIEILEYFNFGLECI